MALSGDMVFTGSEDKEIKVYMYYQGLASKNLMVVWTISSFCISVSLLRSVLELLAIRLPSLYSGFKWRQNGLSKLCYHIAICGMQNSGVKKSGWDIISNRKKMPSLCM